MRFVTVFIPVFLSFLLVHSASAQSSWKELTSAELILETNGVPQNDPFEIGFLIQLKKGWHTYWVHSGDSGAKPRFDWNEDDESFQDPIFPTPMRFEDEGIVTFGFEDRVLLVFRHPGLSESKNFKVSAEWLVCKEICLPAMADFEIHVPVLPLDEIHPTAHRREFEAARRRWPISRNVEVTVRDHRAHYSLSLNSAPKGYNFFPYGNLPYEKLIPMGFAFKEGELSWSMPLKSENVETSDLGGVLEVQYEGFRESYDLNLSRGKGAPLGASNALSLLLFAFLGGLILNLMPCVFPILSLKLFSVLKTSGQDIRKVRWDNFAYVAGVLVSFLLLGLGLSLLRQAGAQMGWGFQLQSPLFVGLLIILFILLALEMLGFYSFDWIDPSKGQNLTKKEGLSGSFFTGVLAVVVASPCTAPFMGAAVGAALTQGGWFAPMIFLSLGLGLSFPYLLLALAPHLLSWIPKPGYWMKVVKEIMAFPLLLTAVWLLWIFSQISSAEGLLALGIALIGFVFAIWVSVYSRKLAWLIGLLFLSGWIWYGWMSMPSVESGVSSAKESSLSDWQPFASELIQEREPGEVFFVNMTADWCITCKVNERLVFETSEVRNAFKELNITKIKGDWTRRDHEITSFLKKFDRAGVPFYVIYSDKSPNGEVLSEVQTKNGFITKLETHSSKGG